MMLEDTYLQEIEIARKTLLDNCENLEQIASYCEDNYVQAKDKRVALQETKNFTTQSLASVAYQINTLATSMLQMLDCTASKIGDMDSSVNSMNLTIDLNNERISRQTIKSSLMTPKDCTRTYKMTKPDNPLPSMSSNVNYVSAPIDYGCLDNVGHGMKLGLPSSSPKGSRSGSITSLTSRGSSQGSIRQKKRGRSPIPMSSPTPSTGSRNSLQPPCFTESPSLDDSVTYDGIHPPPPLLSPPHAPPVSVMVPPEADLSNSRSATPPITSLPSPPPLQDDEVMLPVDDLPPPPRPTSLLLPPASQSPQSISPSPQQQVSSSPIKNGSNDRLHVPGDRQASPKTSPGRVRKATVSRKPSRSPRPMNRPPPPPSAPPPPPSAPPPPPSLQPPPPSATGHTMATEASNPLYFSGSVTPTAPPPPPAPTPSGIPTTPTPGGSAPPPPPPPPPIGGTGIQKPPHSNHKEGAAQTTSKKPPVQTNLSLADQLKERLAKLQAENTTTEEEIDGRERKNVELNNNQGIRSASPSTIETSDVGPPSNEEENVGRTEFISEETPSWVPAEYMWKGVALFDYKAMREDEMTFLQGDIIYIIHDYDDGWLLGVCNGYKAMVPGNYVEPMA